MIWYFYKYGNTIELMARMEGEGGIVGDARKVMGPHDVFHGITFDDLARHEAGEIEVTDHYAKIVDQ